MANTVIAHVACNQTVNPALPGGPQLGGMLLGGDWLALSLLALLISTLALTIVYMVASFLRNAQLLSWSKFELFQVFGTAVVTVFFMGSLWGMCTFDMSWLNNNYSPQDNMYKIADSYFSKLQDLGYLIFAGIMYVTKIISYASRVTVYSHPLGVGSAENPLESMSQLNSLIFVLLSGFVTSFLLLELQMRALDYLAFACIGYLFPMGIFFRCFEPTRSFGGTLLGLSIALFLFYPIIMVFNDSLMYGAIEDLQTTTVKGLVLADSNIQSGNATNAQNAGSLATGTVTAPTPSGGTAWYEDAWQFASGGLLSLLKPVLIYFVAAVALPLINFIVLVEIARGATAFLGDELDVSNLTRMI